MVPKPFANLGLRLKSQKKTDLFTYLLILVLKSLSIDITHWQYF